jgi:putative ABC transport system substrate-binding protein
MSPGGNPAERFRLAGSYARRILKGEKPADPPVQQSTKGRADHQSQDCQEALGLITLALLGRTDEAGPVTA